MGTWVRERRRDHSVYAALFPSHQRVPHPHAALIYPPACWVHFGDLLFPAAGLERRLFVCSLPQENCFRGWRARADRGAGLLPSRLAQ